jgi:predicted ATPase
MNYFERIRIDGYRRLHKLDLPLRPLCVLIGANGSGKSSFLEVFSLLASSASGKLKDAIGDAGGITALLTLDRAKEIFLEIITTPSPRTKTDALLDLLSSMSQYDYQLSIGPSGVSYQITKEVLFEKKDSKNTSHINLINNDPYHQKDAVAKNIPGVRPYIFLETALYQSRQESLRNERDSFRQQLSDVESFHGLNVETRSPIRLPQPLRPADSPGKDGEDLISCLFSLRENNRDRYETIEDTLRVAFPGFERLDFPPVAAGTVAMVWKDRNFTRPLYMNQLSEGMLRFLWLTTLLASPKLPAITLIDEPEVSLHPELLRLLVDLLREASQRTQLIVATHSNQLVRFLEPKEVITFDLEENGLVKAQWADEFDLEEWLKDYTLDEVWRMGRMGGRS